MSNPYAQVALTYVRHAESAARIGYLIAAVVVVLSLLVGSGLAVRFSEPDAYVWLLLNVFCLCLAIVMHAKEQFADSRAHLMPGFRRAHARVAITLALTGAVLLPAAYTWLAGLRSVGLVAISVFLLGAILWLVLRQFLGLGWVLVICLFVPEPLHRALDQLVVGEFEVAAVGILVLGAAMAWLGAIRLFRLNEEMPEYRRGTLMNIFGMNQMASQQLPREGCPTVCSTDKQMASLTKHVRRAATSRWSRVCRWPNGIWLSWSVLIFSLFVCLVLLGSVWISGKTSTEAILLWFFLIVIPGGVSSGQWQLRKLGYELSMPVERGAYLRQVGAAAAISHFQAWGSACLGVALWWLIVAKQAPHLIPIANLLVASALWQIWSFGAIAWAVWLTRNRSRVSAVLAATLAGIMAIIVIAVQYESPLRDELRRMGLLVAAAGLFAVLGVLLAWHAYRRWLVTDVG